MNMLIDMVFMYIFLTAMLTFKLPNIHTGNYLKQQSFIFLMIMLFYIIYKIVVTLIQRQHINWNNCINKSFKLAVSGLFGLFLFTDLKLMDHTKDLIDGFTGTSFSTAYVASAFIVLSMIIVKTLDTLIATETFIN